MQRSQRKIALFPGTFDPVTNGHLDIIRRAQGLFDELVVAIGTNPAKADLFSPEDRRAIIAEIADDEKLDVSVEVYTGLTVDFAKKRGANVMLRGLRNATDLAFEFQLATANRAIADIETVFIMSGEAFGFTSSSLIKQIAAGGDIDRLNRLLPAPVIREMKKRLDRLRQLARSSDALQQ
ncbi:MAG: pantetheine-phosphate adenylyltransferase [Planctomycetes bacterium]|nr:pantetheine-phosphate adenylyltransferase [Planctomycetota bacterium]